MIKCEIKLKTNSGEIRIYHGLFSTTADACMDAVERFNAACISVKAVA